MRKALCLPFAPLSEIRLGDGGSSWGYGTSFSCPTGWKRQPNIWHAVGGGGLDGWGSTQTRRNPAYSWAGKRHTSLVGSVKAWDVFSFSLSHVLTRGLPFRPLTHAVSTVDETSGTITAEPLDFNLSCSLIIKSLMQAHRWRGGFQMKLFNLDNMDKANIKWQPWGVRNNKLPFVWHSAGTQQGLQPYGDGKECLEVNNMFSPEGHHKDHLTTTVSFKHKTFQCIGEVNCLNHSFWQLIFKRCSGGVTQPTDQTANVLTSAGKWFTTITSSYLANGM